MMAEATALKLAVDLLHVPSRVRPMRSAALPDDVLTLLEIAAGDADATSRASELTGRAPDVVRNAAAFFVEQILLAPGSDSYRVLGGNAQTSSGELRRNMPCCSNGCILTWSATTATTAPCLRGVSR